MQWSIHLRGPRKKSAATNVHGLRRTSEAPAGARPFGRHLVAAPGNKDGCRGQPPADRESSHKTILKISNSRCRWNPRCSYNVRKSIAVFRARQCSECDCLACKLCHRPRYVRRMSSARVSPGFGGGRFILAWLCGSPARCVALRAPLRAWHVAPSSGDVGWPLAQRLRSRSRSRSRASLWPALANV